MSSELCTTDKPTGCQLKNELKGSIYSGRLIRSLYAAWKGLDRQRAGSHFETSTRTCTISYATVYQTDILSDRCLGGRRRQLTPTWIS